MNGQAIPGFYYDTEKKKYFKIQGAAASRDLDLKYSAENIRKRQRVEHIEKLAAVRINKNRKERVVLRNASNLVQTCMQRESGRNRPTLYTQCLHPTAYMSGVKSIPDRVLDRHGSAIGLFARDASTKAIISVHGDNRIMYNDFEPQITRASPVSHVEDEWRQPPSGYSHDLAIETEVLRTPSAVSSITHLPTTGQVVVTTYGGPGPAVLLISDPGPDQQFADLQFTPRDCTTIWGVAARPTSNTWESPHSITNSIAAADIEHLAVAASNYLLMFSRDKSSAWHSESPLKGLSSPILSLDWISHSTVAMGCRDGKVLLHDIRSRGSSHILTHPQPVTKIKRADDPTRLICSGLQNSLYLYDIRSARPRSSHDKAHTHNPDSHYNKTYFSTLDASGPARSKKKQKLDYNNAANWSQPLLTFQHYNLDDAHLDIAVNVPLGLVAAAQDAQTDVAIRVSNIYTGKVLREFKRSIDRGKYGVKKGGSSSIQTLMFVDDGDGGGCELWSNWEGGIARFRW
ncbi:hypothetical protein IAQ61_008332 [Plenodomus lingam]|uniref:Myocyte-specific enhancer factor 2d n=1 Tax=Leptosphaeria maculans (strain JN3 / isolate v23.1.3 / race Av1-4-5-6-7-8) TaxID=985895 RepID=E4ZQB5_LEPMJ|nr:hypothetical protein LEMA_P032640.1 [Plenodomus lingam JN3]KAH9867737.1 hypothetical protein IAQ61_008332 [Plenodomus lingam]CBX93590.1 hypothetical protein LEMA_P032640.1 [Plenodomus lingam JN3]